MMVQGGRGEQRIYFLHVHAGANYPKEPPAITFRSRIEMRGVDARGRVRTIEKGGATLLTVRRWTHALSRTWAAGALTRQFTAA